MTHPLTAFDTETTGIEVGSRIIEIASQHFSHDGEVLSEFVGLIDPGMPVPPDSAEVHKITAQDLAGRPDTKEVLTNWLEWLTSIDIKIGMAHFSSYDIGIISWELGRVGLPLPTFPVICTWQMAKKIGRTKNNKLTTCLDHYGIKMNGEAHRALADTDGVRQLYLVQRDLSTPVANPWQSEITYCDATGPIAKLPEHVANGTVFEFDYCDGNGNRTHRQLIPYGWGIDKFKKFAFHGFDVDKQARRTFHVERVVS